MSGTGRGKHPSNDDNNNSERDGDTAMALTVWGQSLLFSIVMRPVIPTVSVTLAGFLLAACSEYGLSEKVEKAPVPVPDILVEPVSINFGDNYPGCNTDISVLVTNIGEGPLTVSGTTLTGDPGFFADSVAVTLGTGESTAFDVDFERAALGSGRAHISVLSDDPDDPEVVVAAVGETVLQPLVVESFVQTIDPVDVLWVIDNSSSMGEEQARVIAEINAFYAWFETLQLDYHMGVVTTDIVTPTLAGRLFGSPTYVDASTPSGEAEFAESLNVGTEDQGDESGLAAAVLALTEPLLSAENLGFYRPDARLVVAFLSDEPEQSPQDAAFYIDFFTNLKADPSRVLVAGIVGDYTVGCATECDGVAQTALPGDKYLDVIGAFGGVSGSICTCDLSPTLDAIGLASTIFGRTFALGERPSDSTTIKVWVDGTETTAFSYDAGTNSIVLDTAPLNGTAIDVEYAVPVVCRE